MTDTDGDFLGDGVYLFGAALALLTASLMLTRDLLGRMTPGAGLGQLLQWPNWFMFTVIHLISIAGIALILSPTGRRFMGWRPKSKS